MPALAWTVAALVGLPLVVFSAELLLGVLAGSSRPRAGGTRAPRTVVVMPAHNEAKIIAETVTLARSRLGPGMELLVIADNCTDDTANQARAAGAGVTERNDPDRRGKGYALAHGLAQLQQDPPDCVIVLDADSLPAEDAMAKLACRAVDSGRPVQSCYLMVTSPDDGPLTRISTFAFMLKNRVRQRGVSVLGGTCLLTGSGMAFPWAVIADQNLANGEIVEDLVLGLRMTLQGRYPLFAEDVVVVSRPAPSDADTAGQRRRWEHGFIVAAARYALPLFRQGLLRGRREPLWTAMHLLVPPFVLLLVAGSVICLALVAAGWWGLVGSGAGFVLALVLCMAIGLVFVAWRRYGRDYLTGHDVLVLPRYVLSKAAIWSGLLRSRQSSWNRTER